MLENPMFENMRTRLANIDDTYAETAKALAVKTTVEWMALLGDTNVPTMRVNTPDELIDDPHLVETGFWQIKDHPTEGKIRMSSPPMNFSETPASIRSLAPNFGEHSIEILQEAGLSGDEIDAMIASGATKTV